MAPLARRVLLLGAVWTSVATAQTFNQLFTVQNCQIDLDAMLAETRDMANYAITKLNNLLSAQQPYLPYSTVAQTFTCAYSMFGARTTDGRAGSPLDQASNQILTAVRDNYQRVLAKLTAGSGTTFNPTNNIFVCDDTPFQSVTTYGQNTPSSQNQPPEIRNLPLRRLNADGTQGAAFGLWAIPGNVDNNMGRFLRWSVQDESPANNLGTARPCDLFNGLRPAAFVSGAGAVNQIMAFCPPTLDANQVRPSIQNYHQGTAIPHPYNLDLYRSRAGALIHETSHLANPAILDQVLNNGNPAYDFDNTYYLANFQGRVQDAVNNADNYRIFAECAYLDGVNPWGGNTYQAPT